MEYFHRRDAFALLFIVICLFTKLVASSKGFTISATCMGNPTKDLTYQNNVASLISELASNQPILPGYSNATVGEAPYKVYGSYFCRGDLDAQLCHDCVVNLTQALSKENATYECFAYDDQCLVHYANRPIYSIYRKGFTLLVGITGGVVPNYQLYNKTLLSTVQGLVKEAALGKWSRPNFATRVVNVTGSPDQKIYTLVQCSPDLSPMNCSSCLGDLYKRLQGCCGPTSGAVLPHLNCMLIYNNQSFFGRQHLTTNELSGAYGGFFSIRFHVFVVFLLSFYFMSKS